MTSIFFTLCQLDLETSALFLLLNERACGRMWVCLRPDLAERMVKDSAGQERPIKLGPKLWVSCSNFDAILSDG